MSIEQNETPRYLQLAAILRGQITSGEIGPGMPIPSKRQLTARHGVSGQTVDRATKLLKDEGLLVTVPGLGLFVRAMGER